MGLGGVGVLWRRALGSIAVDGATAGGYLVRIPNIFIILSFFVLFGFRM